MFGGKTSEADGRHIFAGDSISGGKIRDRAGLIEPQQMERLECGGQAGGIAGRESSAGIEHKVAAFSGGASHFIETASCGRNQRGTVIRRLRWRYRNGECVISCAERLSHGCGYFIIVAAFNMRQS